MSKTKLVEKTHRELEEEGQLRLFEYGKFPETTAEIIKQNYVDWLCRKLESHPTSNETR